MQDKDIEKMKKIIEDKKKRGSKNTFEKLPDKNIGGSRKAHKNKKTGGVFDK